MLEVLLLLDRCPCAYSGGNGSRRSLELPPLLVQERVAPHAHLAQPKPDGRAQDPPTVSDASSKRNRARIHLVHRRTRDLGDLETEVNRLRQHLVIKNEIV